MAPILKLNKHDAKKEMEFELKYLKSLSVKKRFEIMFKKTKEMINLLARHGHRKPFEPHKNEARRRKTAGLGRPQVSKETEEVVRV